MKKFLALVLAVLMIASTVVSVAAFDDVAADNKYANAIEELQEYGVVAGKTETTFAPDELVTRWQMALFMARATSGETEDDAWEIGATLFTDCTQYLGAIQYCFTKGIIKGVTATEFAPNANITLRDAVVMAVRALNYEKEDEYVEASAKKYNVTGANYWLPYWQKADEIGMLENLKDLSVTAELTRAQTVQLIYNMLNSVVYNYDVNGYKYTLEEVVFGGKQIVNVENVTGAWIVETPLQGLLGDVNEDEEYVVVMVNDENADDPYVDVPFADLEAAGVDVENIEDYFGAYIELVNCRIDYSDRDDDGDNDEYYIYQEYEYLAGVNTDNKLVTTDADVVYHKAGDRVRINSKTHYLKRGSRNYLKVYALDAVNGEWDIVTDYDVKVSFDDVNKNGKQDPGEKDIFNTVTINDQLEGKFYDVTFVDTDVDGYYEVAFVSYYNIDTYKAPKSNGKANCGVMKDVKDVEFSEELSSGDVFVYTYDPFMNTVDVKGVIEAYAGEITSYSDDDKKDYQDRPYTLATIELDGEEYEIAWYTNADKALDAFGVVGTAVVGDTDYEVDLETVKKEAGVADFASKNVGDEYEYYLFNGMLLAFGDKVDEAAAKYLVVEEFTDFELYDHIVLSALVNGAEESIKVKKIYTKYDSNGNVLPNGKRTVWANIEDLGYGKLAKKLEDIFGIYSYSVDEDGFYTLTKHKATENLADYVTTVDKGYISFSSWEVKEAETKDADKDGNKREEIIRLSTATTIYLVDIGNQEATMIKPSSYFSINLKNANSVTFMIDRIGYGDPDVEYAQNSGIYHGKASVLYIVTDGEYINHEDYKFVYVQENISSVGSGSAAKYELETGDEEERYFKFTADNDEAYIANTFAAVDEIYVSKSYRDNVANNLSGDLVPGLYLLSSDNIVQDHVASTDLAKTSDGVYGLTFDNTEIKYAVWDVSSDDIDLYSYNYIVVKDASGAHRKDALGSKITSAVEFRFFEKDPDGILATNKSNTQLKEYMTKYFGAANDVKVLIIPNTTTGFNSAISFIGNTLKGIVVDKVVDTDVPYVPAP